MLSRFLPDRFTCALLCTVLLASVLPCRGAVAQLFNVLTDAAIALLFFLHGAKLSRAAVLAGITNWRLHLTVLASTFVLFPLLGWLLRPVLSSLVTPDLYLGVLFLCTLPSTVQSSIAFTSIARGNVSAAVCSASASSLLGIVITPLLVGVMLESHGRGGMSWDAVGGIVLQLLVPFVAGQIAQRWIGEWVQRHKPLVGLVDQGSVLLVVYSAFSAAVLEGLWKQAPPSVLGGLLLINAVLLALALLVTCYGARAGLRQGGRDHHHVLRLQEEPGQRRTDGQGAVCRSSAGHDRAADHVIPSDPVDDLRSIGATLCAACGGGCGRDGR